MSGGATPYIHQIRYPDDPSKTEVIQNIPMPTANAFTVPNFPNYNLGVEEGSPCVGMLGPPTALYEYEAAALQVSFEDQTVVNPHAWYWTFGDGVTATEQHPQHTYAVPGTYSACLSATNLFGTDTYCREITVKTTSIHTLGSGSGLKVVPNPASDQVVIEMADAEGSVYLYDLVGRLAATTQMRSGTATLTLHNLAPGLYTIKLVLEDGREVWDKLVVE
jgi:PKD repeat protein